jgi:hypothetical protein
MPSGAVHVTSYSTVEPPPALGVSFTSFQVGSPGFGGTPVGMTAGDGGDAGDAVGAAGLPAAAVEDCALLDGVASSTGTAVAGSVVACETGPAEHPASREPAARTARARNRIDMCWSLPRGGPPPCRMTATS